MKPQDVIVASFLAIHPDGSSLSYAELSDRLGISASECHACVRRLRDSRIMDGKRRVNRLRLQEVLLHSVPYAFPAQPGPSSLGVPTGAAFVRTSTDAAGPDLPGDEVPWVWPSQDGQARGPAMAPLYPGSVSAIAADPELHTFLAVVDLLRAGAARERTWAAWWLEQRLLGRKGIPTSSVNLRPPHALYEVFTPQSIHWSIARRLRERRRPLFEPPLRRPVMHVFRDTLAQHVCETARNGLRSPEPADVLVVRKPRATQEGPKTRRLVLPGLLDGLAARRVVDELEAEIRRDDGDRVFLARSTANDHAQAGTYTAWGGEWIRYVQSVANAASGMAVVLTTDVREFYPSIDRAQAREVLARRSGAHPSILDLLFRHLECWDPSPRGLPIDDVDVSVVIAHALLKDVDDHFSDGFDWTYRRFMDDVVAFGESKADLDRFLERFDGALRSVGLARNHEKTSDHGPASEIVDELADPRFEQAYAHRAAPDYLHGMWRDAQKAGADRVARHLLTLGCWVEAPASWIRDVAKALPDAPDAVLSFLGSQRLPTAVVSSICEWATRPGQVAGDQLHALDTLSHARVAGTASTSAVAEACASLAAAGEDCVAASALLVLHRFDRERALACPTNRGRRTRFARAYLQWSADGQWGDDPSLESQDDRWAAALIRRIDQGDVDTQDLRRVLRRSDRLGGVPTPLLPLLYRLKSGSLGLEDGDPTVRPHLEHTR